MNMELTLMERGILLGVSIVISCLVFVLPLEKRKLFPARMVALALLGCGMAFLLENFDRNTWQFALKMVIYFAFTVFAFVFCVKTNKREAWYFGVWALLIQQFLVQLSLFITSRIFVPRNHMLQTVVALVIILAGMALVAFTIARWLPEHGHSSVGPRQLFLAFMMCILYEVIYFAFNQEPQYVVFQLLTQAYCITIVYFQNALFRKSALKQEVDTMQLLWRQQQEQYRVSKETIEMINQKCHDLKHQVRAIRTMDDAKEREDYLQEVEDSVQIYSAIVKTGNEILDVILTEKSLLCERLGIHINCVANGELLSFMDSTDLYALFGNALDNAIDSVRKIGTKEKRMIDLMIYQKQRFLMIQVINPYVGKLTFENGLPLTTKVKNGYHGYGLKSMRHTVEKYNGFFHVEGKDECFFLKIMIPLPEEFQNKE